MVPGRMPALLVAALLHGGYAAQNIVNFGAVPFNNSYQVAIANGVAFNAAFAAAQNGSTPDARTVLVPAGLSFSVIPAAAMVGTSDVTFVIDGNVSARTDNFTLWPIDNSTGMGWALFTFIDCSDLTITGSGNVIGNGYDWWWYVILTGNDYRPDLLDIFSCKNVLIQGVRWENAPQYHLFLMDMLNLTVRDMEVYVDVEGQAELLARKGLITDGSGELPAGIPTFPLNTDGIDPAGRDIYITNVTITNFDDAVAVKPSNGRGKYANCSENVLVDGAFVRFGVGMTIGSVPPDMDVNCIRNVTFRNVEYDTPIKAIYIKTNPGNAGSGIIDNILYENLYAASPLWWSIFIGPQQEDQPGASGFNAGCSFFYPLPNTTCPTQPLVPISNVVLRNVTMENALLSPGIILCNSSMPCSGFVFDHVNITTVSNWPVSSGYLCEHASVQSTNSFPSPHCVNELE